MPIELIEVATRPGGPGHTVHATPIPPWRKKLWAATAAIGAITILLLGIDIADGLPPIVGDWSLAGFAAALAVAGIDWVAQRSVTAAVEVLRVDMVAAEQRITAAVRAGMAAEMADVRRDVEQMAVALAAFVEDHEPDRAEQAVVGLDSEVIALSRQISKRLRGGASPAG